MFERHHLLGSDFFAHQELPIKVLERNPQPPYPLHTHDFSELVIVYSGTGTHFTRSSSFAVHTGDVFVINGDTAHGYRDLHNLVLVNVLFDYPRLHIPLYDLGKSPGFHTMFTVDPILPRTDESRDMLTLDTIKTGTVKDLVTTLKSATNSRNPGSGFLAVSVFMQLMHNLATWYDNQHEQQQYKSPYRIAAALSHIENNYEQDIELQTLVDISGMSESSLLRAFKRITGYSPKEYCIHFRLQKACELLHKSTLSITDIAIQTGFNESNYFARVFRKYLGKTPSEFRKG